MNCFCVHDAVRLFLDNLAPLSLDFSPISLYLVLPSPSLSLFPSIVYLFIFQNFLYIEYLYFFSRLIEYIHIYIIFIITIIKL